MMWRTDSFNPVIFSMLKLEKPTGVVASLCEIFREIINKTELSLDTPMIKID